MSILDGITGAVGGAVQDMMDDGKLNGSSGGDAMGAISSAVQGAVGGLDLSKFGDVGAQLVSHLGEGGMQQLMGVLGSLNINPADLMSKLSPDQIPMIGELLKGGNTDGLKDMIGGLLGGGKS